MGWEGNVAHIRMINSDRILVCNPEGKRPLEKTCFRRYDNIKADLKETVCEIPTGFI
jgi:hypothetical protein